MQIFYIYDLIYIASIILRRFINIRSHVKVPALSCSGLSLYLSLAEESLVFRMRSS